MIDPVVKEKFLNGALGKVFNEEYLDGLEALREDSRAESIDTTIKFVNEDDLAEGAVEGSIIEVIVRVRELTDEEVENDY